LSGVPQGGIVSPLLSNILLDKLDTFVETVLIPRYTRGKKRGENSAYSSLLSLSRYHRKKGHVERAEALKAKARTLPTKKTDDPSYRRLKYVRYADDFLLGFVGPKSEAEEIMQHLRDFLCEELKLELSQAKTLITHARSEAARFLGYEVTTIHDDAKRTKTLRYGKETMCRSVNSKIGLRVPRDILEAKCKRYMKGGKPIHRMELTHGSDFNIVQTYQLEYRGIVNYYRLAYNLRTLAKLKWVMETSLVKTLAHKFKVSVPKVYENYGAKLVVGGKEYKGLQVTIPRKDKPPLIASWGGIPLQWDIQATLEDDPPKPYGSRTELVQRLLADFCELCGDARNVEVHHVRAMRKLHEHPGRPKPEWVKRMIALKRKTLILCKRCHEATEHGLPITWPLISLEEILERRQF